ncbi:MAG: hypothetical protein ACYSSI_12550 [Planctomycetota bacterium]
MKIAFLLIVYFAGFATAVYCLAPAPENQDYQLCDENISVSSSSFNSNEFAQSFNIGIHKCLSIAKEASSRAVTLVKQKIQESQNDSLKK